MKNRKTIHYAVRGMILLGFSALIVQLAQSGQLAHYVEPAVERLVLGSGFFLAAMAVYQGYLTAAALRNKETADCGCEELPDFKLRTWVFYALFLLPLILGIGMWMKKPDSVEVNRGSYHQHDDAHSSHSHEQQP